MVGQNEQNDSVQTIFKYVSRLSSERKPEQLNSFLEPNFKEVIYETHESKHPRLYVSMKVNIMQVDFREALLARRGYCLS